MEYSEEEKKILDKFEKQIQKEKEIVNLFNSLREATFKDYFEKLEIQEDEKLVIFQLVTCCLHYLEETANEEENNYDSLIAINVFKALFIDKNTFKMDALDEKKNCFDLVLQLFSDKELTDAEQKKIFEGIKKYKIFNEMSKDFDENYYYVYCLYLIFEYSESKLLFLDTFVFFMKQMYKDEKDVELEIRKDKNIAELDKIDKNDLLKSLLDMYYNEENCYELYINENQLQKRNIPLDELVKKIDENPKSAIKPRKRKKKTKKVQSHLIENKIKEDYKIQEENSIQEENKNMIKRVENLIIINSAKNKNQEDAQKIRDNQISFQKKEKNETRIENLDNSSKESQINQLSLIVDELKVQVDELYEKDKIITRQINELNEKVKIKTSQINELNEKDEIIISQINELNKNDKIIANQIKEMTADIKTSKKIIKNMKNNFVRLEKDYIKIKSELKSIQSGDVFRNIIDLFCKTYQISLDYNYITKIFEITNKISKQFIDEDEKIKLIDFFEKIKFIKK